MKVVVAVGLAAVCAFLVIGCVTAPPAPTGPSDTLVVGRLVFTVGGFKTYGGATADGKHLQGVEITVRNVDTNASTTVYTSRPKGEFYLAGLKPGKYGISQLYYKDSAGAAWADVKYDPHVWLEFRVDAGAVTNIGFIRATYDKSGANSIDGEHEFGPVRTEFRTMFAKSPWNSATWREVPPIMTIY